MDKFSPFRIIFNFTNFFMNFLVILLVLMIFDPITKFYLSNSDFSLLLTDPSMSTQNAVQILLTGDISRILIILGLFIGYCYLFHFLNTSGINLRSSTSNENQKMGITFFYVFIISLILAVAIPIGAFSGYFGSLTPILLFEVVTLTYLLLILMFTLVSVYFIIGKMRPMSYSDLILFNQFLLKENYSKKYTSIEFLIFVSILEMAIFGFAFNLNVLVIVCIVVLLLSLLWIFGIFNAIPDHVSNILLSNEMEISDVYIFKTDGDYISCLSKDLGRVHFNKKAIIRIQQLETNTDDSNQTFDPVKKIKRYIFSTDSWNGFLNFVMLFFAITLATIASNSPENLAQNMIIIGKILVSVPFVIILLLILKKYAIRYWD
jgi:hypothetical protein